WRWRHPDASALSQSDCRTRVGRNIERCRIRIGVLFCPGWCIPHRDKSLESANRGVPRWHHFNLPCVSACSVTRGWQSLDRNAVADWTSSERALHERNWISFLHSSRSAGAFDYFLEFGNLVRRKLESSRNSRDFNCWRNHHLHALCKTTQRTHDWRRRGYVSRR